MLEWIERVLEMRPKCSRCGTPGRLVNGTCADVTGCDAIMAFWARWAVLR